MKEMNTMETTANLTDVKALTKTSSVTPKQEVDEKRPPLDAYRTKTDLLAHAKHLIAAGEQAHAAGQQAFRDAAEAIYAATQKHHATQKDCAKAIGKSETWVSRLLTWRNEGYPDDSPFGPTKKEDREAARKIAHAQLTKEEKKSEALTTNTATAPGQQEQPTHSVEQQQTDVAGTSVTAATTSSSSYPREQIPECYLILLDDMRDFQGYKLMTDVNKERRYNKPVYRSDSELKEAFGKYLHERAKQSGERPEENQPCETA
jgi:hypothetical protein